MNVDTPALNTLTTMFPSIVRQEMQVADVTGGYGINRTYHVQVIVLCDECKLCHELSLTEDYHPNGKCQHVWKHVQHEICTVDGATQNEALIKANSATAKFLRLVARRTPEFSPKFLDLLFEARI